MTRLRFLGPAAATTSIHSQHHHHQASTTTTPLAPLPTSTGGSGGNGGGGENGITSTMLKPVNLMSDFIPPTAAQATTAAAAATASLPPPPQRVVRRATAAANANGGSSNTTTTTVASIAHINATVIQALLLLDDDIFVLDAQHAAWEAWLTPIFNEIQTLISIFCNELMQDNETVYMATTLVSLWHHVSKLYCIFAVHFNGRGPIGALILLKEIVSSATSDGNNTVMTWLITQTTTSIKPNFVEQIQSEFIKDIAGEGVRRLLNNHPDVAFIIETCNKNFTTAIQALQELTSVDDTTTSATTPPPPTTTIETTTTVPQDEMAVVTTTTTTVDPVTTTTGNDDGDNNNLPLPIELNEVLGDLFLNTSPHHVEAPENEPPSMSEEEWDAFFNATINTPTNSSAMTSPTVPANGAAAAAQFQQPQQHHHPTSVSAPPPSAPFQPPPPPPPISLLPPQVQPQPVEVVIPTPQPATSLPPPPVPLETATATTTNVPEATSLPVIVPTPPTTPVKAKDRAFKQQLANKLTAKRQRHDITPTAAKPTAAAATTATQTPPVKPPTKKRHDGGVSAVDGIIKNYDPRLLGPPAPKKLKRRVVEEVEDEVDDLIAEN